MKKSVLFLLLLFSCSPYGYYKTSCVSPYGYPKLIVGLSKDSSFIYIFPMTQDTIKGKWSKKDSKFILQSHEFEIDTFWLDKASNVYLFPNLNKQTNNKRFDMLSIRRNKMFFIDSLDNIEKKCFLKK